MHRLLVVALTATAALAAGPAARAGTDSTYSGGCSFGATTDPTGQVSNPDVYYGTVYSATVVYSTSTPSDNPVAATVTCELRVNGVTQGARYPFTGTVVVTGFVPIQFVAAEGALIQLCTTVDFVSNATPTVSRCDTAVSVAIPPQEVFDAVDNAADAAQGVKAQLVDPTVCPILASLKPGAFNVLVITNEGDTSVAGQLVYDCPPYKP